MQAAREAARRSQCVNNLKQLGLAIQNYASVNGTLPPTGDTPTAAQVRTSTENFGMKPRLLPFLEQTTLFNTINWSFIAETCHGVRTTPWRRLRSTPSSARPTAMFRSEPIPSRTASPEQAQTGYGSYAQQHRDRDEQLWQPVRRPRVRDRSAGQWAGGDASPASPTACPTRPCSASGSGGRTTHVGGLHQIYKEPISANGTTYVPLINYLNSCKTSTTSTFPGQKGMKWFNHSCSQGGGYSHIMTPNLNACEWANTGGGQYRTMVGASSYHSGGVNVGFIDGSVHFVKNSVSQQAWWGIATKSGGEIISANSL